MPATGRRPRKGHVPIPLRAIPVGSPTGDWDLGALLHLYAGWRFRQPLAVPRRVHVSAELLADPARLQYAPGLAMLLEELAGGADLSRRLSTQVLTVYESDVPPVLAAQPERQRRDRDLLLSGWGLHHLHLGHETGRNPAFVRRTRHVLILALRPHDAYLICLREHESHGDNWAASEILATAVRNWPEADIAYRLDSVLGLTHDFSDEDRQRLRRAHANSALTIDGHVYMTPGLTADGSPSSVGRHVMKVRAVLHDMERDPAWLEQSFEECAERNGLLNPEWHPLVSNDQFGFLADGVFLRFGTLVV